LAVRGVAKELQRIGGQGEGKPVKQKFFLRYLCFQSENLKSKIENPKWVRVFALALTIAFGGAVADAQQPEKIFRIGYLDNSNAISQAVLLEALRQELSKLAGLKEKTSPSSTDLPRGRMTVCMSLRRTWFVLRLI
jgi:hypothetical protein